MLCVAWWKTLGKRASVQKLRALRLCSCSAVTSRAPPQAAHLNASCRTHLPRQPVPGGWLSLLCLPLETVPPGGPLIWAPGGDLAQGSSLRGTVHPGS